MEEIKDLKDFKKVLKKTFIDLIIREDDTLRLVAYRRRTLSHRILIPFFEVHYLFF